MLVTTRSDTNGLASDIGAPLGVAILKELALRIVAEVESLSGSRAPDVASGISIYEETQRYEMALIRCALRLTNGHQRRAAKLLGIKVTTLNSKIKRYDIHL